MNQDVTPYKTDHILVYIQYKSNYKVPNKRIDTGL